MSTAFPYLAFFARALDIALSRRRRGGDAEVLTLPPGCLLSGFACRRGPGPNSEAYLVAAPLGYD